MNGQGCVRYTSAGEVVDRYDEFLRADAIMNNLVVSTLLHGDDCDVHVAVRADQALGMTMAWSGGVTITALSEGATERLGPALAHLGVDSIDGPVDDAVELAGRWSDTTGGAFRVREVMRVFRLAEDLVDRETAADGAVVALTDDDVAEQTQWSIRFAADVGHTIDPDRVEQSTRRQIATGRLFGWRVGERIVARLVTSHVALGVVRIGGVYTPDAERGRGYGSAITAAVSALLQTRHDVDEVILNTQSHLPHTNRMYRRLGYDHVGDVALTELIR